MYNLKKYYFINKFDKNHLENLDNKVSIIYRNYNIANDENLIIKIKKFCKKRGICFYLANEIKLAIKLNLDGVYLPSFNKNLLVNCIKLKNSFRVIGSAHNIKEINIKLNQGCEEIFLSPVFKIKNNYLGLYGLINIMKFNPKKTIALGGINQKNIKFLKIFNLDGFAAIDYFDKKKAPKKLGAF